MNTADYYTWYHGTADIVAAEMWERQAAAAAYHDAGAAVPAGGAAATQMHHHHHHHSRLTPRLSNSIGSPAALTSRGSALFARAAAAAAAAAAEDAAEAPPPPSPACWVAVPQGGGRASAQVPLACNAHAVRLRGFLRRVDALGLLEAGVERQVVEVQEVEENDARCVFDAWRRSLPAADRAGGVIVFALPDPAAAGGGGSGGAAVARCDSAVRSRSSVHRSAAASEPGEGTDASESAAAADFPASADVLFAAGAAASRHAANPRVKRKADVPRVHDTRLRRCPDGRLRHLDAAAADAATSPDGTGAAPPAVRQHRARALTPAAEAVGRLPPIETLLALSSGPASASASAAAAAPSASSELQRSLGQRRRALRRLLSDVEGLECRRAERERADRAREEGRFRTGLAFSARMHALHRDESRDASQPHVDAPPTAAEAAAHGCLSSSDPLRLPAPPSAVSRRLRQVPSRHKVGGCIGGGRSGGGGAGGCAARIDVSGGGRVVVFPTAGGGGTAPCVAGDSGADAASASPPPPVFLRPLSGAGRGGRSTAPADTATRGHRYWELYNQYAGTVKRSRVATKLPPEKKAWASKGMDNALRRTTLFRTRLPVQLWGATCPSHCHVRAQ